MSDENVVVVGGGHAAAEVVVALRQKGWQGKIYMISDESQLPYQRPPLSKDFLNGVLSEERLLIKNPKLYEKADCQVMLNCRVTDIDRDQQQVALSNGESLYYDHLILATGTRARKLPIPGADLPCVHYLRTLNDVKVIQPKLKQGARVLLIGGGYIGLEIAASARKSGCEVTLLEAQERVLARVTCETMSEFYQNLHRGHGVDIRLNTIIESIAESDTGYLATCTDGSEIEFDCAIVGIGVLPNVELALNADIECDNGIVVDEYTRSSDHKVYAIGDCSNHPSALYNKRVRLESVPNAAEQAKTVASAINGNLVPYTALPWFWSNQYDIKLQTAGLSHDYDDIVVRGDVAQGKFCIFYLKDQHIAALDAINSPADFMKAKAYIADKISVDKTELADESKVWFS